MSLPFFIFDTMVNKIGAYKAAVVRLEDEVHAYIQKKDGTICQNSIPLLCDEGSDYTDLDIYDFMLAWISFTNDTRDVLVLEDLVEVNPEFDGVTFEFENLDIVCVHDEEREKIPVEEILDAGQLETVLIDLFNDEFDKKPKWVNN